MSKLSQMQARLDDALGPLNESMGVDIPSQSKHRFLRVYGPRGVYDTPPLTPADLRKLAAVLIETAEWLEDR